MYTLPVTIRRSLLGQFLIFFAGALALSFIIYLGLVIAGQPGTAPFVPELAVFLALIIGIVTIVSIYVYQAATFVLDAQGVHVRRYRTLFFDIQSDVAWDRVQEVTITQAGILKALFGVGTILVQSAGAEPNLVLNWVGDVDELRDFIDREAQARQPSNP